MTAEVRHVPERSRFETVVDGHTGVLEYSRDGDAVSMDRVVVPDAIGGRGIAGELTRHALDHVRTEGLNVRPRCPYVRRWIERHPDYAGLVAE